MAPPLATLTRQERKMIEIREEQGRYEVLSPGRHWEAFESKLAAHAAALALAAEVQEETGVMPPVAAPWAAYPPVRPPPVSVRACPCHRASTGSPTTA